MDMVQSPYTLVSCTFRQPRVLPTIAQNGTDISPNCYPFEIKSLRTRCKTKIELGIILTFRKNKSQTLISADNENSNRDSNTRVQEPRGGGQFRADRRLYRLSKV